MKVVVQCIEGLESVAQDELKSLLEVDAEILCPGVLVCGVKNREDLAHCAMEVRSAVKVMLLLNTFTFSSLEQIGERVGKIAWADEIDESFMVRCDRQGEHAFSSQDVERLCGEEILKHTEVNVDLHHPKYTVSVLIKEKDCFVGIDFVGVKLSKRDYRVKVVSSSLNPCVAFSMVHLAAWTPDEVLLDLFCKTGEVVIEACLYASDMPPFSQAHETFLFARFLDMKNTVKKKDKALKVFAFDNLHVNVRSAEVNAKLAMVRDKITFSRTDLDWVDTKFEKESVEKVVTAIPLPSRFNAFKDFEKVCKEFFHQVEFVLKKKGVVVVHCLKPDIVLKQAGLHHFVKKEEYHLRAGTNEAFILKFGKEGF